MSSANVWGSLREGGGGGGGDGHLSLVMLFVGVGLNSSGDPDNNCSCWHVRLVVGLSGGGGVLGGVKGRGSGVARVQQLPGHLVGVTPPHSRGGLGANFMCSEVHSGAF